MALLFHDGTNEVLKKYCAFPWNSQNAVGNVGTLSRYNSESEIKNLINTHNPVLDNIPLKELIDPKNKDKNMVDAYIAKGVHQIDENGIAALPHISVAMNGYIYHVNFLADNRGIQGLINVTRGGKHDDPGGFQPGKK